MAFRALSMLHARTRVTTLAIATSAPSTIRLRHAAVRPQRDERQHPCRRQRQPMAACRAGSGMRGGEFLIYGNVASAGAQGVRHRNGWRRRMRVRARAPAPARRGRTRAPPLGGIAPQFADAPWAQQQWTPNPSASSTVRPTPRASDSCSTMSAGRRPGHGRGRAVMRWSASRRAAMFQFAVASRPSWRGREHAVHRVVARSVRELHGIACASGACRGRAAQQRPSVMCG